MNTSKQPEIRRSESILLVGKRLEMSFVHNQTHELWKSFMSRKKEIEGVVGAHLYSVEIYPSPRFFTDFNPTVTFEKWAAVQVNQEVAIPANMEMLKIPAGLYAVFAYKGKPSDAQPYFQYMYGSWLPASEYEMDNRPYFALMGEKYKGEDPESEEEFWIPIRPKML